MKDKLEVVVFQQMDFFVYHSLQASSKSHYPNRSLTPLQYVSKVLTFGLLHMLLAIFVFDYLQVVVVYKILRGLHNVGVP